MYIQTPIKDKLDSKSQPRGISYGKPAGWKTKNGLGSNGFNESSGTYGTRKKEPNQKKKTSLPAFTPWKVILVSFVIGVCGILYIGHVFSTQQALQEVRQLEIEFNKAQRHYNATRLEYDRLVGPKEIYQRARQQGFINAGPADQIIHLKP
ncbi:hypothetical protein [Rhodohalobacter halophilus]|uniref:hypothetical protein n=1 Tax=Rhodohalobacter halophilus TaxID=1812810 RepID=UPI00083F7BF0|nr:hypothetical protein [Rhodohalobacter halophilus]